MPRSHRACLASRMRRSVLLDSVCRWVRPHFLGWEYQHLDAACTVSHTRCTHRSARSGLHSAAIRRARIDVVFNWLDTHDAVRRSPAPSLRNANAGARHDSAEVENRTIVGNNVTREFA